MTPEELDRRPCAGTEAVGTVRAAQLERVRGGGLVAVMRDELKPDYLADGPRRADLLELCMTMATSLGPATFERQACALIVRPDQCETLRAVAVPTSC